MRLETVTGKLVNPTDPSVDDICITDIAWGLSRLPRFAGHTVTEIPYNVAQHSIYVCELIQKRVDNSELFLDIENDEKLTDLICQLTPYELRVLPLYGLLHDAHEAYLGDIPSPIKSIPELKETYRLLEMKFDHVIRNKFNMAEPSEEQKTVVHYFDKLAQAIEGYQFMQSRGISWKLPKPTLQLLQSFPSPKSAIEAYKDFINMFEFLMDQ